LTTYRAGTNDTPFLLNGQYGVMTDANALLYMRARYYNPYLCRFLNADPSGFAAGLNFYAYANGNPVSLIDPFGLDVVNAWKSTVDPTWPWWKKALSAIAYSSEEDDYRYSLQQRNPQLYQQMYPPVNTGEASYGTLLMVGATILQPELAERTVPELLEGGALRNANYAQRTFSSSFSSGGTFAGQTVEDVAAQLRAGTLTPAEVPIQYIVKDGNTLMLNTRSAQALEQAGIPRAQWTAVNVTEDAAAQARAAAQLQRNGLPSQGTPTVTPSH
jgi:RHS repeat-associated protein